MTLLQIDQVSKSFGTTQALRKVSFDVGEGEVVTLIGESGSGKTTLGKIVLRLIPATTGKIIFQQNDISALRRSQLRAHYRNVQGVFQDPFSSFNPIFRADRVFEMVRTTYFPQLTQHQWDGKIEAALQAVSLNPGDVIGRYPHQLSGGQQQRMLIARALLLDVKLLIADEIISMLDASTRVDILNLLVELKRGGLSILFITHDLALGNYISDRTVILRHGAIVEMGATTKVFGSPQHSYTRNLLTAVPQLHRKWRVPAAAAEPALEAATGTGAGDLAEFEPDHLVAAEDLACPAHRIPGGRPAASPRSLKLEDRHLGRADGDVLGRADAAEHGETAA